MLDKNALLKNRLKTEVVKIKSLGGEIKIQELSGGVVNELQTKTPAEQARYIVKNSIVDENGKLILTAGADVQSFFNNNPAAVLEEITEACVKLNKLNASVEEVEEEAKN